MRRATDTPALLRLLARHQVVFIVVGMTAGVLQGAPMLTFDLDILYARTPENLLRLLEALKELDARFRGDPRRIAPNLTHLESVGHKLFETKLGDFDVLGSIDDNLSYEDVLTDSIAIDLDGVTVQTLKLARLIEIKERAGRPKDLAALPILRSTLDRSR